MRCFPPVVKISLLLAACTRASVALLFVTGPYAAAFAAEAGEAGETGDAARSRWREQVESEWLESLSTSPKARSSGRRGGSISPREDAAGAVDGVKDGGTGFHTNQDTNPWWQVDLGRTHSLSRIVIYNRYDAAERASRLMIFFSVNGRERREVYRHDGKTFWGARDKKPLVVKLDDEETRYVRIQLPGRNYLHLDEVEAYGTLLTPNDESKNLALGRPADQSSSSNWSTKPRRPVPPAPSRAKTSREAATAHLDKGPSVPPTAVGAALDLARKTLAFVEKSTPRPELGEQLEELGKRIADAHDAEGVDWKALYLETRWLRRRIIMSHPLVDFDKLLINRRPPTLYSHQCDQYLGRHSRVGPGLTVLSSWKEAPSEKVPLEGKLPPGCFHHPDLSYDAKTVLFSFCDHTETNRNYRRFWVYEAATDGSWVKQLTGTAKDPIETWEGRKTVLVEDWDPCYVPGGGFLFISTRSQGFGRCHGGRYTPAYLMYRADADGSDIRQISFGEANEWDPSIMHDGRVIYTRWDYINRHDVRYQSLWTLRPDGTDTRHFYGNFTPNPQVTADVKAIPASHKVVATTQGHHSYTAGSLIAIDPRKGEDGPAPVTRLTPEARFPESEGWPDTPYSTPWPLSEDLYLAARSNEKLVRQGRVQTTNAYGIYLIDTLGGRELVYRDPEISCWAPIPFRPRPMPPVVPSMVAGRRSEKTGIFWVQDVHKSTQPIPRGSIRSLRVNMIIGQPTASQPARSFANNEITKKVLGYVPVEKDGSAMFRAPAGVPLQFQALDENGMAVMTMRTITYLHPGEMQSCVGCHEPRRSAGPRVRYPSARKPRDIEPPAGPAYEGGFSFVRTVQPVLDRYCIGCHGLGKNEGKIALIGTPTRYNAAYEAIVKRAGMIRLAQRNQETAFSKPGDYFSHAGKLAKMLLGGHRDKEGKARVALDEVSFRRIVDWLDVNVQFFGDYSYNRIEQRRFSSDAEKALRAHIREAFPGATGEELSKQPLPALVNYASASEGRIVKAPLAVAAGGWGQIGPAGRRQPDGGDGSGGAVWSSTDDPEYRKMLELAKAVFIAHEHDDLVGTCGRGDRGCRCGGCWVRKAEALYRKSVDSEGPDVKLAGGALRP